MRLVSSLAQEFGEVCAHYEGYGPAGKDIVTLVKLFGDTYDHIRGDDIPDFAAAWAEFLGEHSHEMIVSPMTGLVLYNLLTYWEDGQLMAVQLPTLERMLIRDTTSDISEEINRRSEANGSAVLVVPE